MADQNEERMAERVDRLVGDMLAGRHLKATPSDAADRQAIAAAARLAGARDGYPRMSSAFRRRLAGILERGEEPPWVSRRAALVGGVGVAVGVLTGVAAEQLGRAGRPAPSHAARPAPTTQPSPSGGALPSRAVIEPRGHVAHWWDTGIAFAEMVEGLPQRVTAGSVGALLFRKGDQVVAMSAYCTHLPCELEWKPAERVLNCPCHNQNFDSDGQSLSEGYKLPALPLVKARVREGRVEVLGTV